MRSREEISLVGRMLFELVSSGSLVEQEVRLPTQPGPVGVCRAAHLIESKGRGKRHAQDSSGALGMIAEPTGTDGHRAVGRSPRAISYRSPLAGVLVSLQSPANAATAAVSSADPPPLSVFPPPPQHRPGPDTPRRGIPLDQWPEVLRRSEQGESLRQIAHRYGVSHETVRRTLKAAQKRERGGK